MIIVMGYFSYFISANLCHGGKRGVWFRVLCDVLRKHNRCRDGDSLLLCKGNLCCYVDRAWLIVLFSATSFCRLVLRLFVVIGKVYSFHEQLAVVDLIGQRIAEQFADCTVVHGALAHRSQVVVLVYFAPVNTFLE